MTNQPATIKTMQVKETSPLTLALLTASLLFLGTTTGCDGCPQPRNVASSAMVTKEQATPSRSSDELVVYLDTSSSMAGYVGTGPENQTAFSRTLQELRNFVTLVSPPLRVHVRRVDVQVSEPLSEITLSQASVDRSMFNGADTDLAGVFDSFSNPSVVDPAKGKNSPSALPRFHVLVTDGVQSTSQQRLDLNCTAGSDQLCVRKKILNLLNSGWGGCIIGLRSEFHGAIYSEISKAQNRRSVLRFDSDREKPETFRPFYLYVFSPDRAALAPFVSSLLERLKPLVGKDETSLRVLPLTFQYADGVTQADANDPTSTTSLLTIRKGENSVALPEFTITVEPDTAQRGPQPFSITLTVPWSKIVQSSGSLQETARLITWQLTPQYPSALDPKARYPEVKIIGQQIDEETGRIVVQGTAQWLPAVGDLCWRGYRLEGRINPEASMPQWVRDWSTDLDTSIEHANKTLFLETGLLGVWRNGFINQQLVAEAYLVVGER